MAEMISEMKQKRNSLRKVDTRTALSPSPAFVGPDNEADSFATKWRATFGPDETEPPPTPSPLASRAIQGRSKLKQMRFDV